MKFVLLFLLECVVFKGRRTLYKVGCQAKSLVSTVTTGMTVPCDERGKIKIIGVDNEHFVAGRLEICDGRIWRAVYDESWGELEASIVCHGRGFIQNGINCLLCLLSNVAVLHKYL